MQPAVSLSLLPASILLSFFLFFDLPPPSLLLSHAHARVHGSSPLSLSLSPRAILSSVSRSVYLSISLSLPPRLVLFSLFLPRSLRSTSNSNIYSCTETCGSSPTLERRASNGEKNEGEGGRRREREGRRVLQRRGERREKEKDGGRQRQEREEGRNRFLPCWVGLPEGAGIQESWGERGGRGEGGGELES